MKVWVCSLHDDFNKITDMVELVLGVTSTVYKAEELGRRFVERVATHKAIANERKTFCDGEEFIYYDCYTIHIEPFELDNLEV